MLRLHNHETPSRILRRIQEAENDSDMPSLPSMASVDSDDEDEGSAAGNASGLTHARVSISDVAVGSTSSASAGRKDLHRLAKAHQNTMDNSNSNNGRNDGSAPRNILSPLKLNGRSSPSTNSPSAADSPHFKGKGKASFSSTTKSSSPGPLSAVSSNRTVRPTSQSPQAFRDGSATPSVHPANRASKPSRRTQAISFDDSLPQADQSSAVQQSKDALEQQELTDSLNLDFTEDSGFPERPHLETSIWSRRSEGNSSHHPNPLVRSTLPRTGSQESVNLHEEEDGPESVESLPTLPTRDGDGDGDTYDYTTASPTAPIGQSRPAHRAERRGSTSSSASGSTAEIPQIQVTPAPAPMARARRVLIRSASFDRAEFSIGTTPGVGRRLPSAEKRNDASSSYFADPKLVEGNTDDLNDITPSRSSHGTRLSSVPLTAPSTAGTLRGYSYSATPEALATPRQTSDDADLERRKMHLLSTLRMTALKSNKKVRLTRGTPHPRDRRARSATPSALREEDSTMEMNASASKSAMGEDMTAMSGSSTMSEGSSTDLTTNPRGLGNTSLPLAGAGMAADGGIVGTSRFNNAKLNNYLHTLNTHLTTENQNLIKTLEETAKEVSRLMRKNGELSGANATDESSAGPGGRSMSRITEDDEGDATREVLHAHRKTSQDISTLREHLTGSISPKPSSRLQEEIRDKDSRLERLEAALRQRDGEIEALRKDVLRQSKSGHEDDTDVQDAPALLQQQIFDLRDELSRVKAENTVQASDLARARAEQVEQSSRHNKIMAEVQGRADDLVLELEEKEAIIEEIENELVKQEDDFRIKMSKLEEELCKVMEEQEGQLREARKELQSMKDKDQDRSSIDDRGVQELRNRLSNLEQEKEELMAAKIKAEKMLDETAALAGQSTPADKAENVDGVLSEIVPHLQKRVADLESDLAEKEEKLLALQAELDSVKQQHEAEIQSLNRDMKDVDIDRAQLEKKLASQTVLLKETEKAFTDSEDNLRQTAEDLEDARKQLHNVHEEVREMKNEQVELLSSDLQKKYDAAVREIGNLKHQLAHPAPTNSVVAQADRYSKHDSRDIEIKTLRSSNHELETRVNQLRKQAVLAGQLPSNKSSSSISTPGRAEKSVRFDSVRSMRTPKTASQLLGGMSWLDKTGNSSAANATAGPLYTEIDSLNRDIQKYKHLLHSANEEIDDKLRKLDGAGNNVISMAKELEQARHRIRDLEEGSDAASSNFKIVQELRAVRDELTNERSTLLRRLKDIQEQCRQMALQLDASRSSESETQRKLDRQIGQPHRSQGQAMHTSDRGIQLCIDPSHEELVAERDAIFAGVAALKRDLSKVQQDALELGHDLQAAREGGTLSPIVPNTLAASSCTKTSCLVLQARSKQEAKGLLLMISHLKAKFTRESYFRADLVHQKLYLSLLIEQKQKNLDATTFTLSRFGILLPHESPKLRISMKCAVHAVIAVIRMEKLSKEWKKQSAIKTALRDAYRQTRGKAFVPSS